MRKKNKEIRLDNCIDGEFIHNPDCLEWAHQLAIHISEQIGFSPKIGVNVYWKGCKTYFTIDAYNNIDDKKSVVVTILLSKSSIYLSNISDAQLDIVLPGTVDGMSLTKLLLFHTRKLPKKPEVLWVS